MKSLGEMNHSKLGKFVEDRLNHEADMEDCDRGFDGGEFSGSRIPSSQFDHSPVSVEIRASSEIQMFERLYRSMEMQEIEILEIDGCELIRFDERSSMKVFRVVLFVNVW